MQGLLQDYIDDSSTQNDTHAASLADDEMGKSVAIDMIRTLPAHDKSASLPAWGGWKSDNSSDKLVKDLCTFLCQDVSRTPIFSASKHLAKGILTLEYKPARGLATKEATASQVDSDDVLTAKLVYRGAQLALSELAARFGPDLLDRSASCWEKLRSLAPKFHVLDLAALDVVDSGHAKLRNQNHPSSHHLPHE
ncbi:hypothetical protein P7C70_g8834, partial [Phenoliferia sp. Uapishka_3]